MKNVILASILLISALLHSQERPVVWILLEEDTQLTMQEMTYEVTLYQKSVDKRFSHDTYTFEIFSPEIELLPINEIAKSINLDSINYTSKEEFFAGKTACEVHEVLSLSYICLIKEIPNPNSADGKKYQFWPAGYMGTRKDVIRSAGHYKGKFVQGW